MLCMYVDVCLQYHCQGKLKICLEYMHMGLNHFKIEQKMQNKNLDSEYL